MEAYVLIDTEPGKIWEMAEATGLAHIDLDCYAAKNQIIVIAGEEKHTIQNA